MGFVQSSSAFRLVGSGEVIVEVGAAWLCSAFRDRKCLVQKRGRDSRRYIILHITKRWDVGYEIALTTVEGENWNER